MDIDYDKLLNSGNYKVGDLVIATARRADGSIANKWIGKIDSVQSGYKYPIFNVEFLRVLKGKGNIPWPTESGLYGFTADRLEPYFKSGSEVDKAFGQIMRDL